MPAFIVPTRLTLALAVATLGGVRLSGAEAPPPPAPKGRALLPPPSVPFSKAYRLWRPVAPYDTAPMWLHESYWTYGPDGKAYDTWHPPAVTNPETGLKVTFGHEHGDDQSTSDLYPSAGAIAFGYVNEMLATCGCDTPGMCSRNEDHVGHKVTVSNNTPLSKGGTVDMLIKLHQGSHGADAMTNPSHELVIHAKHDSGPLEFKWRTIHSFGGANKFHDAAAGEKEVVSLASPDPSPADQPRGSVLRIIPSLRSMKEAHAGWGHLETWNGGPEQWIYDPTDKTYPVRISHHIYFSVVDPARYYSATTANHLGRTVELCYDPTSPLYNRVGQGPWPETSKLLSGAAVRALPGVQPVPWNDPRSPYRGATRFLELDRLNLINRSGQTKIWTDAYGSKMKLAKNRADGVVVEQFLSVDMSGVDQGGSTQGSTHGVTKVVDYSDGGKNGVHAPN
ncbi:hypothetical protein [Luteolibacter luteus]|uniref:Uncharacterized protein n=1 Tax=Luteolibacter luteus TaxID=2728835 RepID=A0A858RDB4_9BACT|nr:hypothetical protein [Luteolibacter luteus]QJE94300.1 hypothetical protein HHL09_00365 [Luteolibacter luteus]